MVLRAIPWSLVLPQTTKEWKLLNSHLIYWELCKLLWNWRIESVLFCCKGGKVMNMGRGESVLHPWVGWEGPDSGGHCLFSAQHFSEIPFVLGSFVARPEPVADFAAFSSSLIVSHLPLSFSTHDQFPDLIHLSTLQTSYWSVEASTTSWGGVPSWVYWQRT